MGQGYKEAEGDEGAKETEGAEVADCPAVSLDLCIYTLLL